MNTAVSWNASTTHSVVRYGAITRTLRPGHLFDGQSQLGDEPIRATALREMSSDSTALPRWILFFIRNCGDLPGRLGVAVSDGPESDADVGATQPRGRSTN
jgi:hypothetical protein